MQTLKDIIEFKKDEVYREKQLYSKSQLKDLMSTKDGPRNFIKNLSKFLNICFACLLSAFL